MLLMLKCIFFEQNHCYQTEEESWSKVSEIQNEPIKIVSKKGPKAVVLFAIRTDFFLELEVETRN